MMFSPDDSKLAVQVGTSLAIETLDGSNEEALIFDELTVEEPCTEDMPNAPRGYCGNTPLAARFKWAPESTVLAYRTPGAVKVTDTARVNSRVTFPMPTPYCEAPLCSGDFEFQPLPHR
jgi:hypothetical protein